jgi:hypothetical protein
VLFALIERLSMIVVFGGLTIWLANDVRRNLQTRAVPTHTIWSWNQTVTRAQRPFTYWGKVALKLAGVFAAAIMTAWYFYLSATY